MVDHFWVDTNVVIRHIIGEPEHQAKIVRQVMQHVGDGTYVLHIHPIVVAECCYVLEAVYGFEKKEIVNALQTFLISKGVETEEKESVDQGLMAFEKKNVDFEDAYLAAIALRVFLSTIIHPYFILDEVQVLYKFIHIGSKKYLNLFDTFYFRSSFAKGRYIHL